MAKQSRVQVWLILGSVQMRGEAQDQIQAGGLCPGEAWGQPSGRGRGTPWSWVPEVFSRWMLGFPADGAGCAEMPAGLELVGCPCLASEPGR